MEKNKKKSQRTDIKNIQQQKNALKNDFKIVCTWWKRVKNEEKDYFNGLCNEWSFLQLHRDALEKLINILVARGKALGMKEELFHKLVDESDEPENL